MDSALFTGGNFGTSCFVDSFHGEESYLCALVHDLLGSFTDLEFCVTDVCVLAHG